MEKIRPAELRKLILSVIICQAAGVFGSIFISISVSTWYPTLVKPSFTPPGWIIGLAWTILFTLMGISFFLMWRESSTRDDTKIAISIFAAQLSVNVLWSWAFFGLHSPLAGLVAIAVLWVLVLLTIVKFWQISKAAALLLIPYISWVSFAAFLNFTIWNLNP